jgi:hypothetical protein
MVVAGLFSRADQVLLNETIERTHGAARRVRDAWQLLGRG